MNNGKNSNMKLVAVVQYVRNGETKSRWTTIGIAFPNRDGCSYNLKFDYLPTSMTDTTIQMRPFDPRGEDQPSA